MKITQRDIVAAKDSKTKRQWVRTEWRDVEQIAKENGLCYSTWYDRVSGGQSPENAASYPPCPYKGRKKRKKAEK